MNKKSLIGCNTRKLAVKVNLYQHNMTNKNKIPMMKTLEVIVTFPLYLFLLLTTKRSLWFIITQRLRTINRISFPKLQDQLLLMTMKTFSVKLLNNTMSSRKIVTLEEKLGLLKKDLIWNFPLIISSCIFLII